MSTREITFTTEERRLLLLLVDQEWQNVDEKRMLASDRVAEVHLAVQQMIEKIQGKLR